MSVPAEYAVSTPGVRVGREAARRVGPLLAIATFCSGGVALILEQLYEKYLSTLLGASRPAATVVLVTYFAGLAIGAWLCPKRTPGAPRRLAGLELFIAGWAVLVGLAFFPSFDALAGVLRAAGPGTGALTMARLAIAAGWILPPTIAMGAQLPTLAAVLDGYGLRTPENLTRFYTLNLAGAFSFTLATPVVLFNPLGAHAALWVSVALGGAVGVVLWFGLPTPGASGGTSRPEPARADAARPDPPRRIGGDERTMIGEIALAGAGGFVFFALEVLWFHLIGTVCGASTYTFSMLLAVVLLALALAGGRVRRLPLGGEYGPTRAIFTLLGWLLPVLALSAAAWPHAGRWLAALQGVLELQTFWAGEALKLGVVTLIVLPPASGLGMIFPLLLKGAGGAAPDSRRVGRICAGNVVGCVGGALTAGFGLIPLAGAAHALTALWAGLFLAWAGLGLATPRAAALPLRAYLGGGLGLLALVALPPWNRLELTRGYGVYLRDPLPADAELVFFHEDQHAGFVTVTRTARDGATPTLTLLQNGKFDADNTGEMPAQIGLGALAALHAPARGDALIIGCGSGQTAGVVASLGFHRVEIADLSPGHFDAAARWFKDINRDVLSRPNVETHVEDGRQRLLRSDRSYDLVQVEVSSVWFAGVTNLYSREFYELVRRRLTPGGVLQQWIQLHHLTPRELASVVGTVRAVLPETSFWVVGGQGCILASQRPLRRNPEAWDRWLLPDFDRERALTGLHGLAEASRCRILTPEGVARFTERHPAPINTDRNRWLEFHSPQYYLDPRDLRTMNLQALLDARTE